MTPDDTSDTPEQQKVQKAQTPGAQASVLDDVRGLLRLLLLLALLGLLLDALGRDADALHPIGHGHIPEPLHDHGDLRFPLNARAGRQRLLQAGGECVHVHAIGLQPVRQGHRMAPARVRPHLHHRRPPRPHCAPHAALGTALRRRDAVADLQGPQRAVHEAVEVAACVTLSGEAREQLVQRHALPVVLHPEVLGVRIALEDFGQLLTGPTAVLRCLYTRGIKEWREPCARAPHGLDGNGRCSRPRAAFRTAALSGSLGCGRAGPGPPRRDVRVVAANPCHDWIGRSLLQREHAELLKLRQERCQLLLRALLHIQV
mmetsp:Transcript_44016/g.137860  ORF Transcript_44016/g.137860 Transcript_44016/m.137860 type:complete len:316 (+) Transcript_44016:25-972(+)